MSKKLFQGILLLSDCDGTLTDSNLRVSKENQEAIAYFQENGGVFTVATGRYPEHIAGYHREFKPNSPIIASNGGILYDLEKQLAVDMLPLGEHKDALERLINFVFEELPTIQQISLGGTVDNEGNFIRAKGGDAGKSFMGECEAVCDARPVIDIIRSCTRPILRAFFIQHREYTLGNMKRLKQEFSQDFNIMAGWDMGIECLHSRCSKGEMALKLRQSMPSIHTMVAVGDYDNDISLLKAADIGYAVGNAPDFVKRHAKRITVTNEESALAKIIYELKEEFLG